MNVLCDVSHSLYRITLKCFVYLNNKPSDLESALTSTKLTEYKWNNHFLPRGGNLSSSIDLCTVLCDLSTLTAVK